MDHMSKRLFVSVSDCDFQLLQSETETSRQLLAIAFYNSLVGLWKSKRLGSLNFSQIVEVHFTKLYIKFF